VDRLKVAVDRYYEPYNEPGMLQTYLFIHAGRPDLTQHYVREALKNFGSGVAGLPGNDDSGTTSAWLIWSMLGLYPNAGQDYYYIGSPVFTGATITMAGGKKIVINAPSSSHERRHVARATLNGKPLERAWLRHSELEQGARLDVALSERASRWGSRLAPPSLSK
jgi:putative alpha-1,2-mannosidase